MAGGKSYSEQLRSPKWQRKRLEVLAAANWACRRCGDTESTLEVHHGAYFNRLAPWEYPDDTLWVLCEDCHELLQGRLDGTLRGLAATPPWLLPPGGVLTSGLASQLFQASCFLLSQLPADGSFRSRLALIAGARISGISLGVLRRARHVLGVLTAESADQGDPILWALPFWDLYPDEAGE